MSLPQNVSRQVQDIFSYQDILWEDQCFWSDNILLTARDLDLELDEVEEEETDESD